MALEVGIVGLPGAGKTTLFTALTRAGGGEYGKTNVGMAPIEDARLEQLAGVVHARKVTPATIRVQDVPGTGPALLGNLRQVDALLVVLDGHSAAAAVVPGNARRWRRGCRGRPRRKGLGRARNA